MLPSYLRRGKRRRKPALGWLLALLNEVKEGGYMLY